MPFPQDLMNCLCNATKYTNCTLTITIIYAVRLRRCGISGLRRMLFDLGWMLSASWLFNRWRRYTTRWSSAIRSSCSCSIQTSPLSTPQMFCLSWCIVFSLQWHRLLVSTSTIPSQAIPYTLYNTSAPNQGRWGWLFCWCTIRLE